MAPQCTHNQNLGHTGDEKEKHGENSGRLFANPTKSAKDCPRDQKVCWSFWKVCSSVVTCPDLRNRMLWYMKKFPPPSWSMTIVRCQLSIQLIFQTLSLELEFLFLFGTYSMLPLLTPKPGRFALLNQEFQPCQEPMGWWKHHFLGRRRPSEWRSRCHWSRCWGSNWGVKHG